MWMRHLLGLKGTEKLDHTTQIALELIETRNAARDTKTAKLRELRLARECEEANAKVNSPRKKRAARKKPG